MPLNGEYEPSAASWARDQVDLYERSGGTQGTDLNGLPVIILTSLGAKSGKVRKSPLMRVEHDGEYAVVASLGGAPNHPVWYYNVLADPHVELQDGPVREDYVARELVCLAEDGRIVLIAVQGGTKAQVDAGLVLRRRLTLTGSTLRPRPVAFKAAIAASLRDKVWPLLAARRVQPVIQQVFPASQAARAHAAMEAGHHVGKLMLTWNEH